MQELVKKEPKVKKERKPIIRNKNAHYVLYFIEDGGCLREKDISSTPAQLCEAYKKEIENNPDEEYKARLVMKKEVVLEPKIKEFKMTVTL